MKKGWALKPTKQKPQDKPVHYTFEWLLIRKTLKHSNWVVKSVSCPGHVLFLFCCGFFLFVDFCLFVLTEGQWPPVLGTFTCFINQLMKESAFPSMSENEKEKRWVYSSEGEQKFKPFLFIQWNQLCNIYYISLKLFTGQEHDMPCCFRLLGQC